MLALGQFRLETLLIAVLVAGAIGAAVAAEKSPYVDEERRGIKALSEREVDDLLNGRGMGFAKAAELNGLPGPRHVLDLGPQLGLTARQEAAMQRNFADMKAKAVPLGERIVALEAELDSAFSAGTIDAEEVARRTAEIAAAVGALRAVHLAAHLLAARVLTPHQVAQYSRLRGYQGPDPEVHGGHGAPGNSK